MQVAVFSSKQYDKDFFQQANEDFKYKLTFFEAKLNFLTAPLAYGYPVVCVFVNDVVSKTVLSMLAQHGTKLIALRCAGFNNVNLEAAEEFGITVARVPAYSPYAVAEHAVALMMTLNRKIHKAYNRVREGNFALKGLLGFDIHGKTVGIIGTGKIGLIAAKICLGFEAKVIGFDPYPNPAFESLGCQYVTLEEILQNSDIIQIHCPLTPQNFHFINSETIEKLKNGVMIINTSRGALLDTKAVIDGLKSGKIGGLGIDVYEQEGDLFFEDLSDKVIKDDIFQRLSTFSNVLITGHQAFFTQEALQAISVVTLQNIQEFEATQTCKNQVKQDKIVKSTTPGLPKTEEEK